METIIYLIRHSESLKEYKKCLNDETEQLRNEKIPLSVNGEYLARKLSELAEFSNIDVLFSSHYVRAVSTAKYIAEKNNLEIKIDERLRRTYIAEI